MKRFYKGAAVEDAPGGFRVLLDGRVVETPGGRVLLLPARAMAEAIAAEWQAQADPIAWHTMPALRLANTALDGVCTHRAETAQAVLRYGAHDLLCYRAEAPAELARRQADSWNGLLDWAAAHLGARLAVTTGVGSIDQPSGALTALAARIVDRDDFSLAALAQVASITGSLVLALALAEGRLGAREAFRLSRVDEEYQAERWGRDGEAQARADLLAGEMDAAAGFLRAGRS